MSRCSLPIGKQVRWEECFGGEKPPGIEDRHSSQRDQDGRAEQDAGGSWNPGQSREARITARRAFAAILILGAAGASSPLRSADISLPLLQVKTFESHSRLTVPVDQGVETEWKNSSKGFELLLKGIALIDLGIPFGAEKTWLDEIAKVGDGRLASLTASEDKDGVRIKGTWIYPTGDKAPADPEMISFDFRTRVPPAYVIDFWQKQGPTLIQARSAEKRRKQYEALRKAQETAERRVHRRVASLKRQSDVADTGKYCREPMSDDRDIFLEFRPARSPIDFTRWFPVTSPDADYPYFNPKTDTEDANYLRLAQELYVSGKSALAVRTAEFFEKEHAKSPLAVEMKFLKANALLKLGYADRAEKLLRELIVDAPGSPAALHSGIYLAAKSVSSQDGLASLEHFLWLTRHYPRHRLNWVFQLGSAEAMYLLKQTDKSSQAYQWVIENAPDRSAQAEAALRLGDLYMELRQYAQGLAAYYKALKYFGDQGDLVPTSFLNRAEALYQLGQYDRAETAFREFREKFSARPDGWRASFRLGEIEGRKAGPDFTKTSRDFFYETINRYPFSPGATLARIRLLPCGDHGGFDLEKARTFLGKEAAAYDGSGEIFMERYGDMLSLAHVRTLVSLDREEDAIETITSKMGSAREERTREVLTATARIALRGLVTRMLQSGDAYKAVVYYKKYEWAVPESGDPALFDFMLRLSRDAADLGLGTFAEGLVQRYAALNPVAEGREIASDDEDIEDRLKRAELKFSKAKALWVAKREAGAVEIRALLDQVAEESPFSVEKQIILGLLDEKSGQIRSALAHASASVLLAPPEDRELGSRLLRWMASLNVKSDDLDAGLRLYGRLLPEVLKDAVSRPKASQRWEALGVPSLPDAAALVIEYASLLEGAGAWSKAADVYSSAIDAKVENNRILYGYARALLKTGDPSRKGVAQAALKKVVDGKEDDFWKKLSKDSLEN